MYHILQISITMKRLPLIHYSQVYQVIDPHPTKAPRYNIEQGYKEVSSTNSQWKVVTEVILPKLVSEVSAESPRGPEMEAGSNKNMGEISERNFLHGGGKYRAITEVDTTRMAHEGERPIQKIGTPSAYYEVDQLQCIRVRSFQSTSIG